MTEDWYKVGNPTDGNYHHIEINLTYQKITIIRDKILESINSQSWFPSGVQFEREVMNDFGILDLTWTKAVDYGSYFRFQIENDSRRMVNRSKMS